MNPEMVRAEESDSDDRPPGKIVTFYSYKGGTGRSMALANVAWILAMQGRRVLVIDWDFEAPGLHRYYWPFLPDPEMIETPGLIDFFVHFGEAAHLEARRPSGTDSAERPWFFEWTDLTRYSTRLDYDFPNGGVLDLVGAGQQGPTYGVRVNTFQWGDFYKDMGGGVFLETVKSGLRDDYDFVLIDSRTGISDTSGICTVHMPDALVVCFTLNRQSVYGATATASSADAQRRRADGTQGLRIWPVPMRIELAEKERLEAARIMAREAFAPFVWHIPTAQRAEYWGSIEVLYFPYYAYEEVLATIADTPQSTASLLSSMERLAGHLTASTSEPVSALPPLNSVDRSRLLARYQRTLPVAPAAKQRQPRFYISYAKADNSLPVVRKLASEISARFGPDAVFWDEKVPFGAKWDEALERELTRADNVLVAVGPSWKESTGSNRELKLALDLEKSITPVLLWGMSWYEVPASLQERRGLELGKENLDDEIRSFVHGLGETVSEDATVEPRLPVEIDDPQKGQWGGKSERDGRRVSATVTEGTTNRKGLPSTVEIFSGWFNVELLVESTAGRSLEGEVEFHLHPSFTPAVVRVPVIEGRAVFEHRAWGAYTVGVSADDGRTQLELDLATLRDAPKVFRER